VQLAQLCEQWFEVDAAVHRGERSEPPHRLRQLPLGADLAAASGLVPGNRDVHQTLKEVALLGGRRAPGILELFVRGEVLPGPD
jgi:hypothetical protein